MEKYSLFLGQDVWSGAPNIHLIEPGTRYGLGETADLCKTASGEHLPGVMELVESIQPQPDRLYLLNSALGAGEYVGHNLRGDWFDEAGLTHTPDGWDDLPVWDIDGRRKVANATEHIDGWGDLAWGFPTFYNAHRYRHHINKDPNRAYGYILGAFWDDRMHRVILVSELIKSMCTALGALQIYERIAGGEFPDTSMGTKVPFDVCDICGNVARTPAEYCEHVSKTASAPYGMGALLPDGRRCGVRNLYPRFFDDSFVFVGAEKSAKVLSNLTDQVRGDKPYTQRIYTFGAAMPKAASAAGTSENQINPEAFDATNHTAAPSGSEDYGAASVKRAIERAQREATPPEGGDSAAVLSRVLDTVRPATTEEEKEILRLVSKRPGRSKQASSKWAEMLKRVPAPGPNERAIVAQHSARVRPLSKEELLELGDDPHVVLSKAASLGVVFTPEEYQFILLHPFVPKTASALWDAHQVFGPVPIPVDERGIDFRPVPVSGARAEKVAQALQPLFWERSFAPQAVLHRAANDMLGPPLYKSATAVYYPGSEVISELYNDYRAGLVAHTPDWRYASGGPRTAPDLTTEAKLASAARDLSRDLLTLAYWPGLLIG